MGKFKKGCDRTDDKEETAEFPPIVMSRQPVMRHRWSITRIIMYFRVFGRPSIFNWSFVWSLQIDIHIKEN